jgi:ATP-dependent Lhr-like helicase
LALAAAWEKESGLALGIEQDNDCLMLAADSELDAQSLLRLVRPDNVEQLLRHSLERSGFFGARFRESAGRSLLLPRGGYRRRVPLWVNRQRSKKLFAAVSRYRDFPVLVETWRTCLQDEFDLESLKGLLDELGRGEIRCSEIRTEVPSPFCANVVWKQTNRLMYEDDAPEHEATASLGRDLIQELVHASQLRPRLPADLTDRFQRKLQRTYPGYAPTSADELTDWVQERLVLPLSEWQELVASMERDGGLDEKEIRELLHAVARRLVLVRLTPGRRPGLICHIELVARLTGCLGLAEEDVALAPIPGAESVAATSVAGALDLLGQPKSSAWRAESKDEASADPLSDLVAEWLRYYGPLREAVLRETFGLDAVRLQGVLEALLADERLVIDRFRAGDEEAVELEICDAENLERLLRLLRARARPAFSARPLSELPLFLASQQGLADSAGTPDDLKEALDGLFGYPAPARLWESDLLPARLDPYYTAWMDALLQETDLVWFGADGERLGFALRPDLELFRRPEGEEQDGEALLQEVFAGGEGSRRLEELLQGSSLQPEELIERLWRLVWLGRVSNTTFLAVRQGALNRFRPTDRQIEGRRADGGQRQRRRRGPGRRAERWRASRAGAGEWFPLRWTSEPWQVELDALEVEELNKDRVRQLLRRYGIVFRELLERELGALRWSRLFRTLRLMELSGEVLSGHFFEGIPGLQFMAPAAFKRLQEGLPEDSIFWLNAADPASPCGLGLEGLKERFPTRRPSNHLVFQGSEVVVVSRRGGQELEIRSSPEHPHLSEYLVFLKVLLTRQFDPRRAIAVESINGEPAVDSPHAAVLAALFSVTRERGSLVLRRRY